MFITALLHVFFSVVLPYQKTYYMTNKEQKTGQMMISIAADTAENRQLITKVLSAALRWYATSDARYDGDEQNVYSISQWLECVHGLRRAS